MKTFLNSIPLNQRACFGSLYL